jgi:hypothetical protein
MKKIFLVVVCSVVSAAATFAQTDSIHRSGFHFSFVYPLSTHGIQAPKYTNGASFNMLAGISMNERAFALGGLANIVRRNAGGIQFAGLLNSVGNDGNGLMFAGLTNYAGNSYAGVQFAGLTNIARNNATGVQFAGLANMAGNATGIQFAGVANMAGNVEGFQFSGLVNVAKKVNGTQFAGLVNVAKKVSGVQFAGLVNVAKKVSGIQFAGLVNVADSSDCPIGILNIIKNGEKSIALSYSETGSTIVSFRSGGKITYGILGIGYNHKAGKGSFVTEGGLGARIRCSERFGINNEIKIESFFSMDDATTFKAAYSLMPAFKLTPRVELFAGPSINYAQSDDPNRSNLFPGSYLWRKQEDARIKQVYVGYLVGIRLILSHTL